MFKSNIAPTVIDQYPHKRAYVNTLKTGERVIVDPEVTVQRIMLTFYGLINVGAFFGKSNTSPIEISTLINLGLATTYAEKDVGYWLAYLLPGILYFMCPIVLFFAYKVTVKKAPQGSVLSHFLKVIGMGVKKNGFKRLGSKDYFDVAKPSTIAFQNPNGERKTVPWTDSFVDDVRRTLVACQVFLFFPIYNLNDGGIGK